jgi:hypothetical protein
MIAGRTVAIALAVGLLASLAGAGCGDDNKEAAPEVRKTRPTKKIDLDRRPEIRGRGAKVPGKELFTAKIEVVDGDVQVRERHEQPRTKAKAGALVYGGGEIVTGEGGRAKVAVREVGTLTLDAGSVLVVPRYTECGAVLVTGSALLEGRLRAPSRRRCFVHTPSAALWSHRNRAAMAAAPDGSTAFAAAEGASGHVDLLGRSTELAEGKQVVFDRKGQPGAESAFAKSEGPVEAALRPWMKGAARPKALGPWAKGLLDDASRIANRVELDVERLVELMELNRTASAARRTLDPEDPSDAERLEELTKHLNEQAAEMTDLQVKDILQVNRLIAIIELLRREKELGDKAAGRVTELEQKLDELASKLPPLFEKKMKTRVSAGQKATLEPIGVRPKRPK